MQMPAHGVNVPRIRVLLADDHAMIADAFRQLLEPEFEVVGVASDGRKLLQLARESRPDVVLLDLGMPLLNGFNAGKQLKQLLPSTKIVVVTMNTDIETAEAALREWASGYVLKISALTELSQAIISVTSGKSYVTKQIANQLSEQFIQNPRSLQARPLTRREREVLQLLVEGLTMKQAASELQISARTIAFHKYGIMKKHGLKRNADLLRFAIKQQVVGATNSKRRLTGDE